MDEDDRPRARADAAQLLSGESLDAYSLDELDARIGLLEDEIVRVTSHRTKAAAHRLKADALFGSSPPKADPPR